MGEYGIRLRDGAEIKFGTCESMYYLRYDDRRKVVSDGHSLNPETEKNLFWRIPFPDEDKVLPGDYKDHDRGEALYKEKTDKQAFSEPFVDPETADDPGLIQATHPCGYLINLKCYHGNKLPESNEDVQVHWNGKAPYVLELVHIKNMEDGTLRPVVKCKFCGRMWRYNWEDILTFVHGEMKIRLEKYAQVGKKEEEAA
jgi:hypothetical protein